MYVQRCFIDFRNFIRTGSIADCGLIMKLRKGGQVFYMESAIYHYDNSGGNCRNLILCSFEEKSYSPGR